MNKTVSIRINGEIYQQNVPIRLLLVDFIRDVAGLTGTHVGCTYEGVCGACTVHLDGEAVKSCLSWQCKRRDMRSRRLKVSPPMTHCTRSNRRSTTITPCNAASALRAFL